MELMIAMALGGIVMTVLMTTFLSQHQVYLAQDQVVEMQQNARVAMDMLEQDIRSAGYDPDRLGAGITVADANTFAFTRDNEAGRLQTIRYALIDAFASLDRSDGVIDDLGRSVDGGGLQPVAENINQLEFRYLDVNGILTTELRKICFVQVSMLVQSSQWETKMHPGRNLYVTPSGVHWQAQVGFWNVYLTTTLNGRNLGL
jgi:type IV pilus assembly protein PilW